MTLTMPFRTHSPAVASIACLILVATASCKSRGFNPGHTKESASFKERWKTDLEVWVDSTPDALEVLPGRYPDTVSLTKVIEAFPKETRRALAAGILEKQGLGTSDQSASYLVEAVSERPKALALFLAHHSSKALSVKLFPIMSKRVAERQELAPRATLQQGVVPFDALEGQEVPLPGTGRQEWAPGLYQEWKPSSLPESAKKRNLAWADALNQLSDGLDHGTLTSGVGHVKSTLRIDTGKGAPVTDIEGLIAELKSKGYKIRARLDSRLANFLSLYTLHEGVEKSVFATYIQKLNPDLMKIAGLPEEAMLLPTMHSELVFEFLPPSAKETANAEVAFFMGMDTGVAFRAQGLVAEPSWASNRTLRSYEGDEAFNLLLSAGLVRHLLSSVAFAQRLPGYGYAMLGTCHDSVGLAESLATLKSLPNFFPRKPVHSADGVQKVVSQFRDSLASVGRWDIEKDPLARRLWGIASLDSPSTTGANKPEEDARVIRNSLAHAAGEELLALESHALRLLKCAPGKLKVGLACPDP